MPGQSGSRAGLGPMTKEPNEDHGMAHCNAARLGRAGPRGMAVWMRSGGVVQIVVALIQVGIIPVWIVGFDVLAFVRVLAGSEADEPGRISR